MGEVHSLIERLGQQEALKTAETESDRRAIEAALQYMADADSSVGFLYSGWCQATLPHKRLPDAEPWTVETERVALVVEPGRRKISGGGLEWIGVPYGSRARLILLYLQSEALRTGGRDVELGRSLRHWLTRMGIAVGGKSMREVREQAERLSRCRLSFHVTAGGREGLMQQNIVDTAMFVPSTDVDGQNVLFVETARLSESFFEHMQRHPVPIEDAAIRALSNNSQAIDIYCWLAYRLHVLTAPRPVHWHALHGQFGGSYQRVRKFRERFVDALKVALAVYPAAHVGADENGLVLHPSRPPVAPRQIVAPRVHTHKM
jgi:hypothetical protein